MCIRDRAYTSDEIVNEVRASMAMEKMPLDDDDITLLKSYQSAPENQKLRIREQVLNEYRED